MRVIHNDKYTNSTGITGRPKMKTRAAAQPTTAAKAERNEAGVRDETSIASDNLLEKKKEENKEELGEQMKANKETAQAARDREQQAAETAATTASNSSGRGPRIIRRTRNGEEKSPGGEAPRLQMYKKMRYQESVKVNTEEAIRDMETLQEEQADTGSRYGMNDEDDEEEEEFEETRETDERGNAQRRKWTSHVKGRTKPSIMKRPPRMSDEEWSEVLAYNGKMNRMTKQEWELACEKERKKDRRREYILEEEANDRWAERNEGTP